MSHHLYWEQKMANDRIFMPEQSTFSGAPSQAKQGETDAIKRAAQAAQARGSDTDDIAGGIAGFLTGLGTLIATGGNLPTAMAAGTGVGKAVGGTVKEIEGKEEGGLEQAAMGVTGAAKAFGGVKGPSEFAKKPLSFMPEGDVDVIQAVADPKTTSSFPGVGLFKHLNRGGK